MVLEQQKKCRMKNYFHIFFLAEFQLIGLEESKPTLKTKIKLHTHKQSSFHQKCHYKDFQKNYQLQTSENYIILRMVWHAANEEYDKYWVASYYL